MLDMGHAAASLAARPRGGSSEAAGACTGAAQPSPGVGRADTRAQHQDLRREEHAEADLIAARVVAAASEAAREQVDDRADRVLGAEREQEQDEVHRGGGAAGLGRRRNARIATDRRARPTCRSCRTRSTSGRLIAVHCSTIASSEQRNRGRGNRASRSTDRRRGARTSRRRRRTAGCRPGTRPPSPSGDWPRRCGPARRRRATRGPPTASGWRCACPRWWRAAARAARTQGRAECRARRRLGAPGVRRSRSRSAPARR